MKITQVKPLQIAIVLALFGLMQSVCSTLLWPVYMVIYQLNESVVYSASDIWDLMQVNMPVWSGVYIMRIILQIFLSAGSAFVAGLLAAFLFNWFSDFFGGIEIKVEQEISPDLL